MSWYLVFLAAVAMQRLGEMFLTARHTRWALARGGIEYGTEHFGAMKALHTAFLIGCAVEVVLLRRAFSPWVGVPMLVLVALAQGLRLWTMRTLGPSWNARVLVVPGAPVVCGGPYRWVRHPNYAAVVVEGFAVPLVNGAWITAGVFSALNVLLLARRIRCEEGALRARTDYAEKLGDVPLFLPRFATSTASGARRMPRVA